MPDLEIADYFAADGLLAGALPGYTPRESQIALAEAIASTIDDRATLVAEAGTGIGKTWAYLVPALAKGGKVLVSTGTRTLQDQLFGRDLPRVRAALTMPVTIALLKGRSNYICHYHLERLEGDERALKSRTEVSQLRTIQVFAKESRTGDRGDLGKIPEDADIWSRVTSTRENCLGQECPHIRDCFVVKARKQAQEADVVVINHGLFMADLVLREEGITDLLPDADTVIFDEAHQLPDTATRFLGNSVSTHQLLDFGRLTEVAGLAHAREAMNWSEANSRIEHAARELRLCAAAVEKMPGRKATFETIPEPEAFDTALATLREVIESTAKSLGVVAEKHPDLATAARAGTELAVRLTRWAEPGRHATLAEKEALAQAQAQAAEAAQAAAKAQREAAQAQSDDMLSALGDVAPLPATGTAKSPVRHAMTDWTGPAVRWVEHGLHHIRLHSAPLSVAKVFSKFRRSTQAWILTSATLAVANDFKHFTYQLGLWNARVGQWASPFDYPKQGLLYVPRNMPEPQSPQFHEAFVERLMPMLRASPGGSLVLCTTLRAVDRVAEMLADRFDDEGIEWPLLKQGDATRRDLLERFRTLEHPVLVGSASFWEGIDLPGRMLTLVAIDKLPFAPPDDPVIEARLRACRERGGNPFAEYQLPEAAISLKQGAGRLIRTEADWGVLMVADTRLVDKPYGKRLWRGLPPFSRTREASQAVAFFERPDIDDAS